MTEEIAELNEQDAAFIKEHMGKLDSAIRTLVEWKNNEVTRPTEMSSSQIDTALEKNLQNMAQFELGDEDGLLRVRDGKIFRLPSISGFTLNHQLDNEFGRKADRVTRLKKKYGLSCLR